MNRIEVMEKIAPEIGYSVRPLSDNPRITTDGPRMVIQPGARTHELPLAKPAVVALMNHTGISAKLAERLDNKTFDRVATTSLQAAGGLELLVKDGQVLDLVPVGQHHNLDTGHVLDTIEHVIGEGTDYTRALMLPQHAVQLEVVGVDERPVAKGDLVRAGVLVEFSPLGMTYPRVSSYCQRLACLNGARTTDVLRQFEFSNGGGGEGDSVWQFFRRSVREAYGSLERITTRWGEMMRDQISPADRAFVLTTLLRDAGIKGKEAEAVRAEALQRPPTNAYEMHQLITWATSHVLKDPRSIVRAQGSAAEYANETTHRLTCPTCRRVR